MKKKEQLMALVDALETQLVPRATAPNLLVAELTAAA